MDRDNRYDPYKKRNTRVRRTPRPAVRFLLAKLERRIQLFEFRDDHQLSKLLVVSIKTALGTDTLMRRET
jgi:hypothetical protein